ncbi:hypothetical protein GBQ70_08760 [Halomicrobium sp. ZPS1]|uniref:Uncharacterized protein n=1 Tax=Halomicrobium mukohataei TaxID=57705 RepID=A0A4D6KCT6_9EURY|nr:hypothetical protein E5139_08765 [Halomicrobium mukohataei]QFR20523.1 hypothetical protein GBQ70_08760 [Halomicrobium sp. ZPS1]
MWNNTADCNCFKICATTGSRNSVQTYSRRYKHDRFSPWVRDANPSAKARRCATPQTWRPSTPTRGLTTSTR